MHNECDPQILKLDCLRLADSRYAYNDAGMMVKLTANEVVAEATKFYEFLTKKD